MQKDALIGQLFERYAFASSTDIVGLLASSMTVSPFDTYFFMCKVLGCAESPHSKNDELAHGVELGLFRHLLVDPRFLDQLIKYIDLLVGFHIQTGKSEQDRGVNGLKLDTANIVMTDIQEAVALAGSLPTGNAIYINTHRPLLANISDEELRKTAELLTRNPNAVLSAEHHTERQTHQKLQTQLARAATQDVMVIPNTDLYHVMASDPSFKLLYKREFALLWKNAMSVLEETGQCIVHIPVGTDLKDSIPILNLDMISDEMLVQLAGIMADHECFPTIEYQRGAPTWRGLRNLLLARPSNEPKEIERARTVMKRLIGAGVITHRKKAFYSLPPNTTRRPARETHGILL